MTAVLEIEGLNLHLDSLQILDSISCKFPEGMISVIIGPSGAGKSSLLKSITQLLPATGKILYQGQAIENLDLREFRREVVYVSQVPVVFQGTVSDNINWGRRIWDMGALDPETQLELVGLEKSLATRDASDLSVGQQQRLHLARSLALGPKVLLLDEPASGLDAISKEVFEDLILKLQKEQSGLTIIMITHDLDQAKRIAEYALLLDKGKKILEGEAREFFKEVQNMSEAQMLEKLLQREDKL